MYIRYYSNDGLFCVNCLNDFFCISILEIKDFKKKLKSRSFRKRKPPLFETRSY